MKMHKYNLHCPCCGKYIESTESIYAVNGQWVCGECMLDSIANRDELMEDYDGDLDAIADCADYDMRSALDFFEEPYWNAVDHRIDDLKENW